MNCHGIPWKIKASITNTRLRNENVDSFVSFITCLHRGIKMRILFQTVFSLKPISRILIIQIFKIEMMYIWVASWENQRFGFRPRLTQIRLCSYRRWLEAWNFEGLYYLYSENKGADQLRGYREADLRLRFRICKMLIFSWRGSFIETISIVCQVLYLILVANFPFGYLTYLLF